MAEARLKLRDCCLGCASSKVRCPREKPACSRCLKRKITCEYSASKRAARKHDISEGDTSHGSRSGSIIDLSLNDTANFNATFPTTITLAATTSDAVSRLLPTLSSWFASNATTTTAATNSLGASFLPSPRGFTTDPSPEPITLANTSQSSLSPMSPDSQDSADFQASLVQFLAAEGPDADMIFSDVLDFGSRTSGDISSGLTLSPEALLKENLSGLDNTIDIGPSSEAPANKPTSLVCPGDDQVMMDSHCSCLAQALELMRQLFPHPSTFCTTSGMSGGGNVVLPTVPVVIERNRHTVEAISTMLVCPCSQDVHLLAIMAHIVFKVLGWYAVAARRTPLAPSVTLVTRTSSNDNGSVSISSDSNKNRGGQSSSTRRSSTVISSSYMEQVSWQAERVGHYRLDGEDSGRMAAQLVLSELHRVQSLVRELAAKLKEQSAIESLRVSVGNIVEQPPISPFSSAILELLGADLRKRVKELSLEIVRSLRHV